MKRKLNFTDAVFAVLECLKHGTPLDIAINDVANSKAQNFEEYQKFWDFLESLVW